MAAVIICLVSTADICPLSAEDIYPVATGATTAAARGRLLVCLLLRQDRCLLLRRDRCLLLRQDRCLLLRQDRFLLLQGQTFGQSQQTMLMSQGSQLFKSQISSLALNRRKWPEMDPESAPDPENRPPGMARPFTRLWDRSRGPKPPKYSPNSGSTAPGGRYVINSTGAFSGES